MKPLLALLIATTCPPGFARAAVTLFAEYRLGEPGSMGANNLPLDSSGNSKNFANALNGNNTAILTADLAAAAVGSTAYLSTAGAGDEGFYGAFSTGLGTDNYAFGIFARAATNTAATQGTVFSINGTTGGYNIALGANGWEAGIHSNGSGANTTFSNPAGVFTANTWAHLAVIRAGGVTSFYIDGVAQTGTTATASTEGNIHLSVTPNAASYFDGHLDEARIVTFTGGESTANILGALTGASAIPEPATSGLIGAGILAAGAALRRRRTR